MSRPRRAVPAHRRWQHLEPDRPAAHPGEGHAGRQVAGDRRRRRRGPALTTLVVNTVRGTFTSLAVKAPGFGERRKAMLADLAILTGGEVISETLGITLDNVGLDMLGRTRRVVVTQDETTIVGGGGDPDQIAGRVAQIRAELDNSDSDYDR